MRNMNVAIIESPSIHFIKRISDELNKRDNTTFPFIFDLKVRKWAEKLGFKHYPIRMEDLKKFNPDECSINSEQINDIIKFNYSKNKKLELSFINRAKILTQYFEEFYDKYKIDLVIILCDSGLVQGCAKYAAKRNQKILYWENGFFQGTLQIDSSGVSCNNSLQTKTKKFYEKVKINKPKFEMFCKEYKKTKSTNLSKPLEDLGPTGLFEKIFYEIYTRSFFYRQTNPESAQSNIFSILSSFYRLIHRKFLWKTDRIRLPDKFIFIPLQARHDTQVLVNSSGIDNMENLISLCYDAIKTAAPDYKIVVKEHPQEVGSVSYRDLKKKYQDIIWIRKFDIKKILDKTSLIITINSTVGMEALIYHKAVIVLGDHFCNIDEIMYNVQELDKLKDYIRKALITPVNKNLIDKFVYYLRFNYLVEGNWKGEGIEKVVDRIETESLKISI